MSDLIDRQAVIDLLKQMRKDGDMVPWEGKDVFARIRKLPTIQPEKAQLSQEGTTADPMDRIRQLLEEVADEHPYRIPGRYETYDKYNEGWTDAIDKIDSMLPSVQPETQWIPCTERMPEEHEWLGTKKFGTLMSDEVYVTLENPKGERVTRHLHFYNGAISPYEKVYMETWFKGSKPIAWMPLPEPYQKGAIK